MVSALFRYWIGDCIGIVVVTPFLLRLPRFAWRRLVGIEAAGQALALAAVWWIVFRLEATDEYKFFYLFFMPLSWIALRAGYDGTVAAVLAIQVALFVSIVSADRDARALVELQVLMLALAAVGQFTGIVVDERRAQARARQALGDQLGHFGRLTLGGAGLEEALAFLRDHGPSPAGARYRAVVKARKGVADEDRHRSAPLGFPPAEAKRLHALSRKHINDTRRLKRQLMDELSAWIAEHRLK